MVCMTAADRLSIRGLEDARENLEELIDLALLDNKRWRKRDNVAGGAHQETSIERLDEAGMRPLRRFARNRIELDSANQSDIADIDDMRQAFERVHRVLPIGRKLRRTRDQPLLFIDLKRRDRCGAGDRVARIGIAVEEIYG